MREDLGAAQSSLQELRPPVPADVSESSQIPISVGGDDHRTAASLSDDGLAGTMKLRGVADGDPTRRQHPLLLDVEEVCRKV